MRLKEGWLLDPEVLCRLVRAVGDIGRDIPTVASRMHQCRSCALSSCARNYARSCANDKQMVETS